MSTDPLAAFFDALPVADRDIAFRSRVMERVARQRLRVELALRLAIGLVLVALVGALVPAVLPLVSVLSGDLLRAGLVATAAVGVGLAGHAWLTDRLRPGRWLSLPR